MYQVVVVFVQDDAWNTYFGDRDGLTVRGGVWAFDGGDSTAKW